MNDNTFETAYGTVTSVVEPCRAPNNISHLHEVIATRADGQIIYIHLRPTEALDWYQPHDPIVGDYTLTDHCRYAEPMPDPQTEWIEEIERLTTPRAVKVSPTTADALLRLSLAIERLAGAIERHR